MKLKTKTGAGLLAVMALTSCTAFLPRADNATGSPWDTFSHARESFDSITPNVTTSTDLKRLGLDPYQNPNITILNYTDLAHKLLPNGILGVDYLDPAVRDCFSVREHCYAYELTLERTQKNREGNFFADFFNFHRVTDVTGWRFDAIIVLKSDLVVYKLWSGEPSIHKVEQDSNPLGPLQGLGGSIR